MNDTPMKKSRRRTLWNAVTAVCLVGLVVSAAGAGWTLWRSDREDRAFEALAEITSPEETVTAEGSENGGEGTGEKAGGKPNYQELFALNEDFAGWLRIDGTKINYPVMHTPEDQQYYIHRDFYGKDSFSGTPFMGDRCDVNSQSIIIYAHNMNNGTMFGELDKYADQTYWKEHPVIEFDTLEEERQYEVFAAFQTRIFKEGEDGFRYYQYIGDLTEKEFSEFTDQALRSSLYNTEIVPSYGEQLLILSTCSYHVEDGRFVVAARRTEK